MANEQWHEEGLDFNEKVFFTKEETVPTSYYVGLANNTTLAKTDNLAAIAEVTGAGYARQPIASDATANGWTVQVNGTNDREAEGKQVTFTATGTWLEAKMWFLATTIDGTGKLLASGALPNPVTMVNNDTYKLQPVVPLSS